MERLMKYCALYFLMVVSVIMGIPEPLSASEGDVDISYVTRTEISKDDYILKAGDKVKLTVFPEDEYLKGGKWEISPEGNLTMPLIGKVAVAGKTVTEAQDHIVELLEKDYFVDSEAVIEVLAFKDLKVVVLGQVAKPGTYSFPEGSNHLTLIQAIALAGGFSDIANVKKIKLMRKNEEGSSIKMKINANDIIEGKKEDVAIMPNDIIHVPESFFNNLFEVMDVSTLKSAREYASR